MGVSDEGEVGHSSETRSGSDVTCTAPTQFSGDGVTPITIGTELTATSQRAPLARQRFALGGNVCPSDGLVPGVVGRWR